MIKSHKFLLIHFYVFFSILILGDERHGSDIFLDRAEIRSQKNTMKISSLVFKSAFGHLKQMSKINSKQLLCKYQWFHANGGDYDNNSCHSSIRTECSMSTIAVPAAGWNIYSEESSYSRSPAVDPFWPLCMFELRGKCNNDECPWQHVKDYDDRNYQNQHSDNDDAGMKNLWSMVILKHVLCPFLVSKHLDIM